MKEVKNDIKLGKLKSLYLFFGEEVTLIHHYLNLIRDKFFTKDSEMMNVNILEGKVDINTVIDLSSTLPFLWERRLVILKDSGLFSLGRKDDTEKITEFVKKGFEPTTLIFVESEVDKRNKLYKRVNELGHCAEFKPLSETELTDWIVKAFARRERQISSPTALHLIRSTSRDMKALTTEIEKLTDYTVEKKVVSQEDIDLLCPKSLELNIFVLVDAVSKKQTQKALEIYSNMLLMKEQPLMILGMIARQFRILLQTLTLSQKNHSSAEIASMLSMQSFIVSSSLKLLSAGQTPEQLITALEACLEADIAVKTGLMSDRLAVELLIVKCAG